MWFEAVQYHFIRNILEYGMDEAIKKIILNISHQLRYCAVEKMNEVREISICESLSIGSESFNADISSMSELLRFSSESYIGDLDRVE